MNGDRVNYSMGRKISDGQYGSVDVHFSYTTDVQHDEKIEQAIERCVEVVENFIADKQEEINNAL